MPFLFIAHQFNLEQKQYDDDAACLNTSIIFPFATVLQARLWRYLYGAIRMAPELADAIVEASVTEPQLVRIKEVFESVETFLAIEKFLIDTASQGR